VTAWPDLLDALEARTALLEQALAEGADDPFLPDLELAADGPLPPALGLRAQVLLARTRRLEQELARRTGTTARARAAYASH
jgi:hypothetical protein